MNNNSSNNKIKVMQKTKMSMNSLSINTIYYRKKTNN